MVKTSIYALATKSPILDQYICDLKKNLFAKIWHCSFHDLGPILRSRCSWLDSCPSLGWLGFMSQKFTKSHQANNNNVI